MSQIDGFYTVTEAAKVLGRSRSTVSRYIQEGLLKAREIGPVKLIEQSAAHAFIHPLRGNPAFRKHNGNGETA